MKYYAFKKKYLLSLARFVDCIGYIFRRPPSSLEIHPKKILVVRLDQLGDIVQTLPVFDSLRRSFPGASLHALTTKAGAEFLKISKSVDDVYVWDCPWFDKSRKPSVSKADISGIIKSNDYDCVLELRGDIRLLTFLRKSRVKNLVGNGSTGGGFLLDVEVPWNPKQHAIDKNLDYVRAIGGLVLNRDPHLPRKEYSGGQTYKLVIHPDAGTLAKKWPLENFVDLINRVQDWPNLEIHLIGLNQSLGKDIQDRVKGRLINHMGSTTLSQLINILETSDGLLTNDSGPAHLMAAFQKPVWILWSGTAEETVWAPRGNHIHILKHLTACTPCSLPVCNVSGHPCLTNIQVDTVFQKLKKDIPVARTLA